MIKLAKILAMSAIGTFAAPAAAQYPYPSYPQPYPPTTYPYPRQPYPGQPYPGYGGNVVGSIIDQLLGNRYSVTDRGAVSRCAVAALVQAWNQYRG